LFARVCVLIGQSVSGDDRCERTDSLPEQQLIKITGIGTDQDEDPSMKPVMGLVVFCLPVPTGLLSDRIGV
jgi:hypothetical protein